MMLRQWPFKQERRKVMKNCQNKPGTSSEPHHPRYLTGQPDGVSSGGEVFYKEKLLLIF